MFPRALMILFLCVLGFQHFFGGSESHDLCRLSFRLPEVSKSQVCACSYDCSFEFARIARSTDTCVKLPAEDYCRKALSTRVLSNAILENRKRVCLECSTLGYSPKDCTTYACANGCQFGHMKFDKYVLRRGKKGGLLTCEPCRERQSKRMRL